MFWQSAAWAPVSQRAPWKRRQRQARELRGGEWKRLAARNETEKKETQKLGKNLAMKTHFNSVNEIQI